MNIGFIGLGIMGAPMAGHLIAAGHSLFLKSRRGVPEALLAAGGTACATAAEVAERADTIILMLPDTPDVEQVLFGADGVAGGLSPGKTVIDMSSIAPLATKDFAARIAERGGAYLDAPVSGGEVGAKNAALSIMVGGEAETFARAEPLFAAMGKTVTHVGPVGSGQVAKVANQIIVALTIEAVAEGLLFASKAGADPAKVRQAITGGLATSRILELHGARMIERTFDPGFRIGLHQKDLNLALDNARTLGLSLPATALAQQLFSACVAQGGAAWDHSALVKALEALANHAVGDAA
ncbi:2-hydroxy-3-oxopropionate reductase [Methylobacterium sp. PvP062]|jgi:2-hydroxy-3-oxopropionate reductase|uniref:2-hydroxy-3-oxopropionate reductase n=2 Tax=Methylobacterium radiotolerans TaxID=31998 RepID=B1M7P7_METRJ|nr:MULTISPECIES: 2-hydroxy-3-oxopropionate reductase [Methylobacterium]MCX7331523.1 2-hydroxy-3-oxopropionate reductase [Hyphomicrobiales bacterium]ACB23772.1 2-hydroxy-3-oxopropionate reductase [Methylobacterium radiotolerans JCM 2831]KIU35572.1 tartronate semialdehyde reductase [Methylobacterium radiotolerans]KTS02805.1 tartronate semialdehyde reductase [Methylobacterium radiotolerans]MBN6822590.1 2-hydroxy-3-oxopropionate reductase [Methylobacterium organophilum]